MRRLFPSSSPLSPLTLLAPSPAREAAPRLHSEVEAWAMRAAASNGFGGDRLAAGAHGGPMAAVPAAAFIDLSDPLDSAVVRVRRLVRRAMALYRLLGRRNRQRAALRELQSLDAATLRDIGLTRSEVGSVIAELAGAAPSSRRAVIAQETFRWRTGA